MAKKKTQKEEKTDSTESAEVKTTYQDLVNKNNAVEKLMEVEGLDIDTDIKLSLFKKELNPFIERLSETQKELSVKYAEKDENGKPVHQVHKASRKPIPGNYKIDDMIAFSEAYESLMDQEVEFKTKISFTKKEFDVEGVTGKLLLPMLDYIKDANGKSK